jgi:hypothetical protein
MSKSKLFVCAALTVAGLMGTGAAFAAKASSSASSVKAPIDPFALKVREPVQTAVRILAPHSAAAPAAVRPPYRPPARSPYRPTTAGPFTP